MKQAIQPYVHFDDKCREAMHFYQSLFGGELEMMPIGDSPARSAFSEDMHDQILHSSLRHGEFALMGSDMCGQGTWQAGNTVELSLNCSTEEEINSLYGALSEGGTVLSELRKEFWGALFAMVVDRFGVRWMLSLEVT